MDDQLRRAQRRAKAGDLDDQVALLVEQLRAGTLPLRKLRHRAQKGDAAARRAHRLQYAGARTYTKYFAQGGSGVEEFFRGEGRHSFPSTSLPGDRIVPVQVEKRLLTIFGSVLLDDLVPSESLHWQRGIVLVEHPLRRRLAPRSIFEGWRFQTPKGVERPLKHVEDGQVIRAAVFDGLYQLSDATARAVLELLASS